MRVISTEIIKLDRSVPVYDVVNSIPNHNFIIRTNNSHIVAHNCGLLDEVSFVPGANTNLESSKIMSIYRNLKRRMQSRFTRNGELSTLMFMVSSKKSESDAMEKHIEQSKKDPNTLIVDKPIWEVKPQGTYKSERFKVAVGNKYMKSKIVTSDDNEEVLLSQGYSLIEVPIDLYNDFNRDVDTSLNDYAGISSSVSMKFIAYDRLVKCYSNLINPFTSPILKIGMYDKLNIKDFFRLDIISDELRSLPLFIHIDTSLTGDRTGISGTLIMGAKYIDLAGENGEGKKRLRELIYRHLFSVGIECPPGSEIALYKNREFIYWLKDQGFNIKGVSTDGFQSADTKQLLISSGFNASIISMDRTPIPYSTLKASINEQRYQMIRIPVLETELINLEKDNFTGKIDHNSSNTKDISDSITGSLYNAFLFKDEYIAYLQDDFDIIHEINNEKSNSEYYAQQLADSLISSPKDNSSQTQSTEILIPGVATEDDMSKDISNLIEDLSRINASTTKVKSKPNGYNDADTLIGPDSRNHRYYDPQILDW